MSVTSAVTLGFFLLFSKRETTETLELSLEITHTNKAPAHTRHTHTDSRRETRRPVMQKKKKQSQEDKHCIEKEIASEKKGRDIES